MIAAALCALVLTAVSADYAYSRAVAAHAARWEARQARGADGVRLDCAGFTCGTGRVALLLVHGFGSSPAVFRPWAEELAARGFTCRAMRLPGFGEPLDAARGATADAWRRAVDAEIDALRRGHDEVWLVGHSMGATLCAEAAARRPDDVAGVVLLAPLFGVSSRRSLGVPPERLFGLRRVLQYTDVFETCFPIDADDPAVAHLEARDRFVPLNIYTSMFEVMRAGRGLAPRLRGPVFMAAAVRDRVVDLRAARRFAAELGPGVRYREVEPAGHVLPLDTGWRALCGEVEAFIRGAAPGANVRPAGSGVLAGGGTPPAPAGRRPAATRDSGRGSARVTSDGAVLSSGADGRGAAS